MHPREAFACLGIEATHDVRAIKRAYTQCLKDGAKSDTARFLRVREAYETALKLAPGMVPAVNSAPSDADRQVPEPIAAPPALPDRPDDRVGAKPARAKQSVPVEEIKTIPRPGHGAGNAPQQVPDPIDPPAAVPDEGQLDALIGALQTVLANCDSDTALMDLAERIVAHVSSAGFEQREVAEAKLMPILTSHFPGRPAFYQMLDDEFGWSTDPRRLHKRFPEAAGHLMHNLRASHRHRLGDIYAMQASAGEILARQPWKLDKLLGRVNVSWPRMLPVILFAPELRQDIACLLDDPDLREKIPEPRRQHCRWMLQKLPLLGWQRFTKIAALAFFALMYGRQTFDARAWITALEACVIPFFYWALILVPWHNIRPRHQGWRQNWQPPLVAGIGVTLLALAFCDAFGTLQAAGFLRAFSGVVWVSLNLVWLTQAILCKPSASPPARQAHIAALFSSIAGLACLAGPLPLAFRHALGVVALLAAECAAPLLCAYPLCRKEVPIDGVTGEPSPGLAFIPVLLVEGLAVVGIGLGHLQIYDAPAQDFPAILLGTLLLIRLGWTTLARRRGLEA